MGFRFPSKTVTASGGGVGSFARRPRITPTFFRDHTFKFKFKDIKKKQSRKLNHKNFGR